MRSFAGRLRQVAGCFVVLSALFAANAFADAVQAGVTIPAGQQNVPVVTDNGQGYTPGTYAIGTIHLNYTFVGTAFPAGSFATFQLNLSNVATTGGRTPAYPTSLFIEQHGSNDLVLTPSNSPLAVNGLGALPSVLVTIDIPASTASDPELDDDGDVIVGRLRLRADSPHLGTVTDILVKITLVHPTDCIKVYGFITDAELENVLTSINVNVNQSQNKVSSSNPGSLSKNVMIVNTCSASETFDLRVNLDPWFSTQSSGNAVFTFTTAGEVDPDAFAIATFGSGTPKGLNMCLPSVTVAGGTTYLAAVHMSINRGASATGLPSPQVFTGFSGVLATAGTSCTGDVLKTVTTSLPFSVQ